MAAAAAAAAAAATHQSVSLYCGDLHPEVNESVLFEIFNSVGPVASIRVCRDAVTRRSLGYAYVNFHNPVDAERALDTLNFSNVRGRPMRLMWSHRDPSLRKSNAGNIFVKNLDKSIDTKALYDTFSIFGNILSCKVSTDETGQSRGYGFVHYEAEESGKSAIDRVNGMLIGQKKVFVGPFVRKVERVNTNGEPRFTNIYVKDLAETIDEDKVRSLFGAYGSITSCVIMRDETGKSKGFGFLNFDNADAAKDAVDALNGKEVDGKVMYAGRAQKKSEREAELRAKYEMLKQERQQKYQGVNLYIKNLDDTIDDDKLREEFGKFGTIQSVKIMRDEKGASRGFGFVCFSSVDEATKAVTDMNGKLFNGKPLYVALAQRKEIRRQQLELQHAQAHRMNMAAAGMRMPMPGQPGMFPGQPGMYFPPNMPPGARPGFMYPPMGGAAGAMARPGFRPNQGGPVRPGFAPSGPMPYGGGMVGGMPQRQPGAAGPAGRQNRQRGPQPNGAAPLAGGMAGGMAGPQAGRGGQAGGNRQFRYTPNARNKEAGMQQMDAPLGGGMGGQQMPNVPEPLTAAALASATQEQQKEMLGERLYMLIAQMRPELAGKITGMLLEMENSELLALLESPQSLASKVDEAVEVLNAHGSA